MYAYGIIRPSALICAHFRGVKRHEDRAISRTHVKGGRLHPDFAISVSPALVRVPHSGDSRHSGIIFLDWITAMTPTKKENDDSDIRISSEAAVSVHEGGVVILDNSKGRLYSSGPAGAYIWRCIEQQLSLEAIAGKLHTDFQIELTTAREHAARFIEQLRSNG